MLKNKALIFFLGLTAFFSFGFTAHAQTVNDRVGFYVDENLDAESRISVNAFLIKTTPNLSFYVESDWWNSQDQSRKNDILINLDGLSFEFSKKIYPSLTAFYGSEANPGIDRDPKITILFEQMKANTTGYFRSQDGYSKLQLPSSNEREMIYISLSQITSDQLKVFVAHEFTHIIEFNQKDKLQGVSDDIWLNEARADYTSTLLGYDSVYEDSNIARRVSDFLEQPNNSLTDWQNTKYDYAVATLFTHYLVDHYGVDILADSLKSKKIGIDSINEALAKSGIKETFSSIFTDWTIAMVVNSCAINQKYCYFDRNLVNLKISPVLLFLPLSGNSSLSITNSLKNWSGNWQKIIGGRGNLTLDFPDIPRLNFEVYYILFGKSGIYSANLLPIYRGGKNRLEVNNFGDNYSSLVVMPSLKINATGEEAVAQPYTFTVSIGEPLSGGVVNQPGGVTCGTFNRNLYFGLAGNSDVRCLQQFLKNQGASMYPEGLVTGYFGPLTKAAVIRFQARYGIPQTGFVGILTRGKIKQLLAL